MKRNYWLGRTWRGGNRIRKEEDVKTRIEMRQPKLEIVKETRSDSTLAQPEETKVRTHTIKRRRTYHT